MQAIAFELKGTTAFFKKPDVNANVYFTYNHIHKIALYGLLGAIIGLGGYNQQKEGEEYPEFYAKLKGLKVSIVPHGDRGYFTKRIQTFNNSVGYASKEEGGNLIVKEQWLENPHWTTYILDDDSVEKKVFDKLKDFLLNKKCTFIPYLGKNDHPADIGNVRLVDLIEVAEIKGIDSLFYSDGIIYENRGTIDRKPAYFYQEFIPVSMNEDLNSYEFEEIVFTNYKLKSIPTKMSLYQTEGRVISFI